MKYSKTYKHTDGKFYVMKGSKKFFSNMPRDTENGAKELAAALSANYYMQQAQRAVEKMTEKDFNIISATSACLDDAVFQQHRKTDCYDTMDIYAGWKV